MANDRRPESLLTLIKALAEFTLLVCGIIGIAVQVFHDQGWLKQLLEKLVTEATSASMIGILIGIAVFVVVARWYDRVFSKAENANALGNFLMKAMMVAGAYFLYLYITTGSFKM